jgi:SanA protein
MRRSPAGALASLLERPLVLREPLQPLDAIVVLGAPLGPGGTMTAVLDERVGAAAELWRAGAGRLVVATGGGAGPRPEAAAMAEALRARGVTDVLVEPEARTTADNARLVAALLAPLGARSVWLVTQPFHGRRAARLFRAAGLDAHVWHIADSIQYRDRRRALRWLVREYAAWLKHFARAESVSGSCRATRRPGSS